jgi:osmoprotectant transport system permease protein
VLVLYALLPIVRSTIIGITGVDRSVREAGMAMGMTPRELLRQVELPLALPSIIAGVRVAAVVGVGSATIAAAIGAGGLGQYIYRGLSMVDTTVILAGAIPAACLALAVDGGLLWLEGLLSPRRRAGSRRAAATLAGVLAALVLAASAVTAARSSGAIVVGSKNFTEQLILGEIVAQAIERETGLAVRRQLNLGGTLICDRALRSGDIDVYVEYTGTALTTVFHQPPSNDRGVMHGAAPARTAGARSCPRSASTTRLPSWCADPLRASRASGRLRTPRESHRNGAPASGMSFWSGRTATADSRRRTASPFAVPRRPWT